jgi:hypothetical protein
MAAIDQDVEQRLLSCVAEAAQGDIDAAIGLSVQLGIVEESVTRRKDATCPTLHQLQVLAPSL